MKPKIVIEVSGGTVQRVVSNQDIDYVILDYDNERAGDDLSSGILSPDAIFENLDLTEPEKL